MTHHKSRSSVADHFEELRQRLFVYLLALFAGGVAGYYLQDQIIGLLVKPLGQKLVYSSPTGGFDFLIKICLFFGFLVSLPIGVYQIIQFVKPAIPSNVAIKTRVVLLSSSALAFCGVVFAYTLSLPAALKFLNRFSNQNIQSLISAQEYFSFFMIYVASFAVLFQMPLIFATINKIRRLSARKLFSLQRWVILISFILAAILTPTPDPINQTLMAAPMILLYEISVAVVWHNNRRSKFATASKVR